MTKLYLHIGPHKTGSTYIQKFFNDNRDGLLGLGVNYANVGLGVHFGQHVIIEQIKSLDQAALQTYLPQFLGGEVNFVSSENFDRLNAAQVDKFGKALMAVDAKLEVKVVYYYRNYVDLLPSWWQEEVKHGSAVSFYEFALPHILRPFTSNIVNPAMLLDSYANVFAKENITVVDYDLAVEEGNILHPIFKLLNIDLGDVKNEIVNASAKLEVIEIIRALNAMAKFNDQWHLHKVRTLFLRKKRNPEIANEVEQLSAAIRNHMKPVKFAGGFFEKSVLDVFKKRYEACFFNSEIGEIPDREVSVPSDNWMLKSDILGTCERVYQHVMSGDVSY